jgi:alginate O-acetyltransferase complex protein AlgI
MSVASYLFLLVYLPITLVLWRQVGKRSSIFARLLLLAANLIFCGWSAPCGLLVLCAEGSVTYALGGAMDRRPALKKPLLAAGAVLVLAVLLLFKYTGFFLAAWTDGLPAWLTPLGLSFSSFQQLFWLRDRYHGETEQVSPLDYACCLTLFATATCGPITRVGELAPQLRTPEPFTWDGLASGLYCFALGLAKKVLLAGIFARGANYGYALAGGLSSVDAALTILSYTLQIYFDFSGYCDMAWGMGRMMGLELPVNFDSPYRACSIQSFWDRWHITLSRFFRSCVYIPLGGNRRGLGVTCRNIMVIFLLSGLWHGAGWGFVLWGALHGAAMVIHRLCRGKLRLPRPLGWVLTFVFVNLAWVFFRADSIGQALALLGDLVSGGLTCPTAALASALLPTAVTQGLTYLQTGLQIVGCLFTYWVPLAVFPLGMALLCLPNPVRQAERFRPTLWRGVLTALCLAVSVVFLSGVETFIYANF